MPMYVHGAHLRLEVGFGVGYDVAHVEVAHVSFCNVGTGLGYVKIDAWCVVGLEFGTCTCVGLEGIVESRCGL